MNVSADFLPRLLAWVKANDLTYEQAAVRLGVGRPYFSQIVNGRTPGRKFVNTAEAMMKADVHKETFGAVYSADESARMALKIAEDFEAGKSIELALSTRELLEIMSSVMGNDRLSEARRLELGRIFYEHMPAISGRPNKPPK